MSNTNYIVIRAKILDNSSNYKITVSQDDGSSIYLMLIIILCVTVPIWWIIVSAFGILVIWLKKRRRRRDNTENITSNCDNRTEMAMSNMPNGLFWNLNGNLNTVNPLSRFFNVESLYLYSSWNVRNLTTQHYYF